MKILVNNIEKKKIIFDTSPSRDYFFPTSFHLVVNSIEIVLIRKTGVYLCG